MDAIHVSTGSMFPSAEPSRRPEPRNSGGHLRRHDLVGCLRISEFPAVSLSPTPDRSSLPLVPDEKGHDIEGINLEEARQFKDALSILVIVTGGFQTKSVVRRALEERLCDGVTIARPLIANNDLPLLWQAGRDSAELPCSYRNKCLVNAPKNPLGC